MKVVGLTGSIGMGKSTTAAMFAACGAPVYDADAAVHELYALGGGAVEAIGAAFPEAVVAGAVDRARLSQIVVGHPDRLKQLETIVHPLVAGHRQGFFATAAESGADLVILDVRELDAFEAARIPGARHLPRGQLELRVNTEFPDPTVRIVACCEFGKISTLAAATLRDLGFTRAVALDGGVKAWREAGFPVEGP